MEPKDWISRNHRELLVQVERFLEAIDTDAGRSKSKLTAAQLAGLRAKKTALTELVETKESAEAALSAGAGIHREYRIVPKRSGRSGEPSNAALAY
jgi:hypothetical protein